MVDFWRDFWVRETGMGQQVVQLRDRYDDDDDDDDDEMRKILTTWGNEVYWTLYRDSYRGCTDTVHEGTSSNTRRHVD